MRSPLSFLRCFGRDESGTVMAEAVLVLPFMLWSYLALFVYWDGFRSINTVQKAAYTISDQISREMTSISPAYIDGLDNVMEYLIDEDQDVRMRVTSIYMSGANHRLQVDWSRSPNNAMPRLTTATVQALKDRIPDMSDYDFVVLLETETDYVPAFDVGVEDQVQRQFIVTRPRFVQCVLMTGEGTTCPLD